MGIPQEKKERQLIDLYCYIKVSKVKPVKKQMTLFQKLGVAEISTQMHFKPQLLIQVFIGIGMSSLILYSHLVKMQRIVLLNSLLWWELGTDFPNSQVLVNDCRFGVSPIIYPDPVLQTGTVSIDNMKYKIPEQVLRQTQASHYPQYCRYLA